MSSSLLQRNSSIPQATVTPVVPPTPPLVLYPPTPTPAPTTPTPAPTPPTITIQTTTSECEILYGRFVSTQPVGPSQIAMLTTFKTLHPECTAWADGRISLLSLPGAPAHQAKPSLLPFLGIALGIGALIYFTRGSSSGSVRSNPYPNYDIDDIEGARGTLLEWIDDEIRRYPMHETSVDTVIDVGMIRGAGIDSDLFREAFSDAERHPEYTRLANELYDHVESAPAGTIVKYSRRMGILE